MAQGVAGQYSHDQGDSRGKHGQHRQDDKVLVDRVHQVPPGPATASQTIPGAHAAQCSAKACDVPASPPLAGEALYGGVTGCVFR